MKKEKNVFLVSLFIYYKVDLILFVCSLPSVFIWMIAEIVSEFIFMNFFLPLNNPQLVWWSATKNCRVIWIFHLDFWENIICMLILFSNSSIKVIRIFLQLWLGFIQCVFSRYVREIFFSLQYVLIRYASSTLTKKCDYSLRLYNRMATTRNNIDDYTWKQKQTYA